MCKKLRTRRKRLKTCYYSANNSLRRDPRRSESVTKFSTFQHFSKSWKKKVRWLGTIKIRQIITKLKTLESYVLCSALANLWVFATRGGGSIPAGDNSFLICPQSPHFFAIFLHENEVYALWCKNKKWSVNAVLHDRLISRKSIFLLHWSFKNSRKELIKP